MDRATNGSSLERFCRLHLQACHYKKHIEVLVVYCTRKDHSITKSAEENLVRTPQNVRLLAKECYTLKYSRYKLRRC